jgi:uncharacterized damage-inducible protein DinB
MITSTLLRIYERDLSRLKKEIESYHSEATIWHVKAQIPNSAGNLALHLVGNLQTYIGAVLGKTDYVRNREAEFSLKNVPRAELISHIEHTQRVVLQTIAGLSDEDYRQEFPMRVFEEKTSTEYMLIHLATHLTYHLGQINYHRRLLEERIEP